jgi:hypothetical protein
MSSGIKLQNKRQTFRYVTCSAGTWLISKLKKKKKENLSNCLGKSTIVIYSDFILAPNMLSTQKGP